jgi:hypothetical protein
MEKENENRATLREGIDKFRLLFFISILNLFLIVTVLFYVGMRFNDIKMDTSTTSYKQDMVNKNLVLVNDNIDTYAYDVNRNIFAVQNSTVEAVISYCSK